VRAFGVNGYRLGSARLEVRLVYTAFLAMVSVGMLTMAAFEVHHIGPTPARIAAYYRGGDRGGEMAFAKTFRELVEVTHFHSFTMGLVYLVLAHLFIATPVRPLLKGGLIIVGGAGLVGDLVSPWLIRYVSADFAYVQLTAWGAEWIGFGAFVGAPVAEMWFAHDDGRVPPE
jgi:hypothetical protein